MIPVNMLSLGWRVNWPPIPSSGPEGGRYRIAFLGEEVLEDAGWREGLWRGKAPAPQNHLESKKRTSEGDRYKGGRRGRANRLGRRSLQRRGKPKKAA